MISSWILLILFVPNSDRRLECLRAAYPEQIGELDPGGTKIRIEGAEHSIALIWDDGREDKTFQQRLDKPDLEDTLSIRYPVGRPFEPPAVDDDPGRIRLDALFRAVYGSTRKEVRANLVDVSWMPEHTKGKSLRFNRRAGAAAALRRVSADLEKLPERFHDYVTVTAGTFYWRKIHGTERLSAHSWGIAIDINVEYTDYWRWAVKREPTLPYRNRIPLEIVDVFERHGFIWGGKWHHYDTMHFEYRPELLHPSCVRPRQAEIR